MKNHVYFTINSDGIGSKFEKNWEIVNNKRIM